MNSNWHIRMVLCAYSLFSINMFICKSSLSLGTCTSLVVPNKMHYSAGQSTKILYTLQSSSMYFTERIQFARSTQKVCTITIVDNQFRQSHNVGKGSENVQHVK